MGIHKIVQQSPLQPGAQALVNPEAGAGQLGPPVVIDEAQLQTEIHMMLRRKIEFVRFAIVAQGLVLLLAARRQIRIRQVGQAEHERTVFRLHRIQLLRRTGNHGF